MHTVERGRLVRCWLLGALAIAPGACAPVGGAQQEGDGAYDGGDDAADGDARARRPVGTGTGTGDGCIDADGDGRGVNCALGPDCNDHDPAVAAQCCIDGRPSEGCGCDREGATANCDAVTNSDAPGPDGLCHPGVRTCHASTWSTCVALDGSSRGVQPPATCGSSCNPDCRVTTVCPDNNTDIATGAMGVALANAAPPAWCPTGTALGGIQLPSSAITGGPSACASSCGGQCCSTFQTCWTRTDNTVYPSFCTALGSSAPPPATQSACGPLCATNEFQCGFPPSAQCCAANQTCRQGKCETLGTACNVAMCPLTSPVTNNYQHNEWCIADCTGNNYCDIVTGRCRPNPTASCDCTAAVNNQYCRKAIADTGGTLFNDIFRTANGGDARTLQFGTYYAGVNYSAPAGCSVFSGDSRHPTFPYAAADWQAGQGPANCVSWTCYGGNYSAAQYASALNALDWVGTNVVRTSDSGGVVSDGNHNYYYPWRGVIWDLGAPANRVVLFPQTDHTSDNCLEPFEYSVYLSDNPNATTIADAQRPDPSQWNLATLAQTYTQGWTRNPSSLGNPSDTTDLTAFATTSTGQTYDAVSDAMATVWAVPCGYSFRYASVVAGNYGALPACGFDSFDAEVDAIAGLTVDGNALSFYKTLPYGAAPAPDSLAYPARVRTADIYMLVDTSGTMNDEITKLKAQIGTGSFLAYPPAATVTNNENVTSAKVLNELANFYGRGNLMGFANDYTGSCASMGNASDAVYKVVITASRPIHIDTFGSSVDTVLYILRDNGGGTTSETACNDNVVGSTALTSAIDTTLTPGTYYFVVDGTSGYTGSAPYTFHYGLASSACAGGIVGGGKCQISDARFGLGNADDFPVTPYGVPGTDVVLTNLLDISSDIMAINSAASMLPQHAGGDSPNSFLSAVSAIGSGRGFNSYLADRTTCPAGQFGYPCFRPGTLPIVLAFTDAMFHNDSTGLYNYNETTLFGTHQLTYPSAVAVTGNDAPASARMFNGDSASYVYTGSTTGLAQDHDAPCASGGAPDAVFQLTLTGTRVVHLDVSSSVFDTTLYITRSTDGVAIACNDDAVGTNSELNLTLTAGTYNVWVDGRNAPTNRGAYTFRYAINPAGAVSTRSATLADAVAAINSIGGKVAVVNSCGNQSWCSANSANDAVALANQTNTLVAGGAAAVYQINSDGTDIGTTAVQAIFDIANFTRMDVSAVALDNPATTNIDERCFVANPIGTAAGTVRLSNPTLGETAPYAAGQCSDPPTVAGGAPIIARQCLPGTPINFRPQFRNNCAPASPFQDTTYTFNVGLYGNGVYLLGTVPVTVIVPRTSFPPTGTFSYDVDATSACSATQQIDWQQLQYAATTPNGTTIDIDAQTADTRAELDAGHPFQTKRLGTIGSPTTLSPIDTGAVLGTPSPDHHGYLRLIFTFHTNATGSDTPVLSAYRQLYNCIDAS